MEQIITITFGDCGENHVGMQKIGELATSGYSIFEMLELKRRFDAMIDARHNDTSGTRLIYLDVPDGPGEDKPAAVLLIKNYIKDKELLFAELKGLEWDTKAKMYGRVVNKHARYNLCFDEKEQEPDYDTGKGRIISWDSVSVLKKLKSEIEEVTGDRFIGEGNYYYDIKKCGIGYHGDSERRKVIGCRVGTGKGVMPLYFQWYYRGEPIGKRITIPLENGDVYIMSKNAVGFDWKSKSLYTLRHSTGCAKYVDIKPKKAKTKK